MNFLRSGRKSQQKGGSFYKEIKAYLKYQKLGEDD
jgi:hypothetical protein